MADVSVWVTTPAISSDLVTLDELKILLGISPIDTSQDVYFAMQIAIASEWIAEKTNRGAKPPYRTLGRQTVIEKHRDINGKGRIWLTHYPIADAAAVTSVMHGETIMDSADYELVLENGKLSIVANGAIGAWSEPVTVEYTGGYVLPDDAPYPLKQAVAIYVRDEKIKNQQAAVAGVRMIAHRDARIMYFDPNSLAIAQSKGGGSSPSMQAIDSLLTNYMRIEV
jgi:hypothetical protein